MRILLIDNQQKKDSNVTNKGTGIIYIYFYAHTSFDPIIRIGIFCQTMIYSS